MPSIENGHVEKLLPPNVEKVKDGFVVIQTKISIVCDYNYILNKDSPSLFTCMDNGWDFSSTPICQRMFFSYSFFIMFIVL